MVLVRYSSTHLTFMNSWGHKWGDGGFFHVKASSVLPGIEFFDIFWEEDDLTHSEKMAFKEKGGDVASQISSNFDCFTSAQNVRRVQK